MHLPAWTAALLLGAAAAIASPAHRFHSVVVVGDSLSDSGNVYRLTNHSWPADRAYYRGRFSNGPVWVEVLTRDLAHFLPNTDLLDLSYGGATTNNTRTQGLTGYNSTIPVPSVLEQVDGYLKSASKKNIGRSLFIITGGSNDAFFGLGGPISPDELAKAAAADLLTASRRLYKAGARHFLITGVPGLQSIPYVNDFAQVYASSLNSFADTFIAYLRAHLHDAAGKGATVVLHDQAAALGKYIQHKAQLPGWNVRDACLVGVYPGEAPTRALCEDPQRHVFWDVYHPSAVTHRFIAHSAIKAIATSVTDKYLPHSCSLKIHL
ncbi:hypothetical protein OC844_002304 [Tilletia horrida]|nr:hypothetical protein OC844_002304 [Tilletia horrida]